MQKLAYVWMSGVAQIPHVEIKEEDDDIPTISSFKNFVFYVNQILVTEDYRSASDFATAAIEAAYEAVSLGTVWWTHPRFSRHRLRRQSRRSRRRRLERRRALSHQRRH